MATTEWKIDPSHSGVHFAVRHMVVSKVRGSFGQFEGSVQFDDASKEGGKVSVSIDAASIDTREPKRDAHLKSADFFDAEKFPKLTFESTKFEKVGGDKYKLHGNLTMRGVTKPVVLETELLGGGKDPWGNQRIGFSAKTAVERKEFGLNWNQMLEAGGVLVGEKVEIELEVQAVKQVAATKAA